MLQANKPPPIPGICGVGAAFTARARRAAAATERMFAIVRIEEVEACPKGYKEEREEDARE